MCAMEAVAWIAGEPHSDQPKCVSPVLASFVRYWNDCGTSADRDALTPCLERLVGTRNRAEGAWAMAAGRWILATGAPSWLAALGRPEAAPVTAMADRMDPVALADLQALRDLRSELRRACRSELQRSGAPARPSATFEAAPWAAVADRYARRPAPIWFKLVEGAWGAGWAAKRLCHVRDPVMARALDAELRAESLRCLGAIIAAGV